MSMRKHAAFGLSRLRSDWANTRFNVAAMRGGDCDPAWYLSEVTRDNFIAYAGFRACANAGDKAMSRRWQKLYRYTDEVIAVVRDGFDLAFGGAE